MAMNKYMHPRNIYKVPPDFKQLAITYPEFRKYVHQDVAGKITIDFKNLETLRALTCTLLKKDFNLDIEIPLNRMIPTVPLRLNYILWLEDLLSICSTSGEDIRGIDIGTGASCIYPLLAAKKGWHMLATDVDNESITFAQNNVQKNNFSSLITVVHASGETLLKEIVEKNAALNFDFSMCNPPFFASTQELQSSFKARRHDRPKPRNAFCATITETVVHGGEIDFISKMIHESRDIGEKIRIYTTMIGHKSSLPPLKKLLREGEVTSFKQTEFCQGRTTRWALAWTFCDIDLRKIPVETVSVARKQKSKRLQHLFDTKQGLGEFSDKLKSIFTNLQVDVKEMKENKHVVGFCMEAHSNTWSHQRRKRREQRRLSTVLSNDNTPQSIHDQHLDVQVTTALVANMSLPKSPNKREHEDSDDEEYYNSKKIKASSDLNNECYLKCSIIIKKEDTGIFMELQFLEGASGLEGMHQVLQYLKNQFKE